MNQIDFYSKVLLEPMNLWGLQMAAQVMNYWWNIGYSKKTERLKQPPQHRQFIKDAPLVLPVEYVFKL